MRSRLAGLAVVTATLVPLAALTPAHAEVVVDCAGGALTVDQSVEVVTVTGMCTDVIVSGSNSVVTVPDAASLTITGSNTEVTSGALGDLEIRGANSSVSAPSATDVTVSGGNSKVVVAGAIGTARITEANSTVKALSIETATIKASNSERRRHHRHLRSGAGRQELRPLHPAREAHGDRRQQPGQGPQGDHQGEGQGPEQQRSG